MIFQSFQFCFVFPPEIVDVGIVVNSCEPEAHTRKAGADHKSRKKEREPPRPQHIHHIGHLINTYFLSQVIHHINHIRWQPCNNLTLRRPGSSATQQVGGYPGLHRTLSQKKMKKKIWIFQGVLLFLAFGNVLIYFTRFRWRGFLT